MAAQKSFVALNIGSQTLSGAVFSPTKDGGLLLQRYEKAELLGDPAADASKLSQTKMALNELVEKLGIKKSATRYAISGQSVFTRFVKLPPLDDERVEKMVKFEAEQNVPFPLNEVIWHYQLLGENESGDVEAVLVAIKAESLNDLNDAIEESGLNTRQVDVAPMALYNAFRYNHGNLKEPSMLIDIGARTTNVIYVDGPKIFTRSIPVGGSTITSNIAREFGVPFAKAEERKIEEGFVALGGQYAPHDDPEIDALSKVARNTVSRLHAEIARTTTGYRTQQRGRPPKRAFICGGSSSMPFMKDFFQEKLNLPVEYFNPLQNVIVGPDVDVNRVSGEAHTLGELVGLGLRSLSSCPMKLDLVPDKVGQDREIAAKKPFLVMSLLSVAAMLGAGALYFNKAASASAFKESALGKDRTVLSKFADSINDSKKSLEESEKVKEPLRALIQRQRYWVGLLSDMNSRLSTDSIWLTTIEPLSGGNPVMKDTLYEERANFEGWKPPKGHDKKNPMIESLRVVGLYRDDDGNSQGPRLVDEFLDQLRESEKFNLKGLANSEIIKELDPGASQSHWAYKFELHLPLGEQLSYKN